MQNRRRRMALVALASLACWGAAAAAAQAGEHRVRLIKSWPESPIVEGRAIPGRVEIWFDYTAGVAIHRLIVNAKRPGGTEQVLKSETFPPGMGTPRPSPEEIAEAMDLVREDKEFARLIDASHASIDGGFQIFEAAGALCGPGSRCLQVQLMTEDRLGLIRNVVVDLTKQAIVYRAYVPKEGKGK